MGSGTNLVDAEETTECIVKDANHGRLARGAQCARLSGELTRRGTQVRKAATPMLSKKCSWSCAAAWPHGKQQACRIFAGICLCTGRSWEVRREPSSLMAVYLQALCIVQVVELNGWQAIDAAEVAAGQQAGKPREKFVEIPDMLQIASANQNAQEA